MTSKNENVIVDVNIIQSQCRYVAKYQTPCHCVANLKSQMADLSQISDTDWNEAASRGLVLRPLLELKFCPRHKALEAALKLGLSERQIYRLIKKLREFNGEITALLPNGSNGGRGKKRLVQSREELLQQLVKDIYLTRQKYSVAYLIREIQGQSLQRGLKSPSASTIRRRIQKISLSDRNKRGEQHPETEVIYGEIPAAEFPLDWIQIDHTPVDLIVVDPIDRLPIGRPWITLAIDVFSRCITGFYLSLESPSSTSVGLCLSMAVSDKVAWLEERNIEADWPIAGKPCRIGVDNASEFHSMAFERGCEKYNIKIEWRPLGLPHYGGIIERVIGTLMQLVHALPGTTFSNPTMRGDYNSDKTACLTLEELERWLTIAITKYYHLRPHEGIDNEIPLNLYQKGILERNKINKIPTNPYNYPMFFIDFLPIIRRSLQRDGITIDHITYYSNTLRPWIQAGNGSESLLIRRDPRDLSKIFVFDKENSIYIDVPYRILSRPGITLWEHKLARKRLREKQRTNINEASLFEAIEEMRAIENQAKSLTRSARRNRTRRKIMPISSTLDQQHDQTEVPLQKSSNTPAVPFDDIEIW